MKTLSLCVALMFAVGCGQPMLEDDVEALKAGGATTTKKGGSTPAPAAPSYQLLQTDMYAAGTTPTWRTAFPMSTLSVSFATEITGTLTGRHVVTVFVFAPGGQAYARYDIAFATDVVAYASEQQAERTATGYRVWVTMPVAGTMITQYDLRGAWTASAYVDSASTATAGSGFTLE
jgi:hypothetical protein